MLKKCNICKEISSISNDASTLYNHYDSGKWYECERCGKFFAEDTIYIDLETKDLSHTFSSYLKESSESKEYVRLLNEDDLDKCLNIPDKQIKTKYDLFLKYIKTTQELISKDKINQQSLFWCKDSEEYEALINKANHIKHIIQKGVGENSESYKLTFEGREYLEGLDKDVNSNKIFMAFHFTEEMKKQFEDTIKKAVSDASSNKLEAIRVSSSIADCDTKIDDELIGMIKSSKAIIADFTGNRTAVYYEAGFAMGLGIPVIWTCKDSEISAGEEGYRKFTDENGIEKLRRHIDLLSFDTRQYPHILWKDKEDLYKKIVDRLKAKIL